MKQVSYRQYIHGSCFSIHSATLCLFIGTLNPFKGMINKDVYCHFVQCSQAVYSCPLFLSSSLDLLPCGLLFLSVLSLSSSCIFCRFGVCGFCEDYLQLGQKKVHSCEYTKQSLRLIIHYCLIFHTNDCEPTFAPPCVSLSIAVYFKTFMFEHLLILMSCFRSSCAVYLLPAYCSLS